MSFVSKWRPWELYINKEYPWQPPKGKVDFGQGRAEAYEAANFPEIEQCRGPVASNAIEKPRQTI